MHRKRIVQATVLFCIAVSSAFSQSAGLPFIKNYQPQEYKSSPQNWSVAQDRHGILYFGNNDGILEFDGSNWNLIDVPGVSSIATDSIGYIYAGFDNDIGYCLPDDKGNYRFVSLKPLIPEGHKDINLCYRVHVAGGKVIFQTSDHIYVYDHKNIKCIQASDRLIWSFLVNNRIYVTDRKRGMSSLQDDSLRLIPGGELFRNEQVIAMMPYRKNNILVVTVKDGVLIYNPGDQKKLYKPDGFESVNSLLIKNIPYCSTQLANGDYAVGTIMGGVILFTPKGQILGVYNKSNGLQDNSVYWLYCDNAQQLWAALDNGISNIQNNIPFSKFNETNGLSGGTMCQRFYNGRFYVGTNQYLYVQDEKGNFESIPGTESQNFSLFESHGILLLANLSGISEIRDKKATPLKNTENIGALSFSTLRGQPDLLLTGATYGLYLLKFDGREWTLSNRIKGFSKPSYKVDEDADGNIWASTFLNLYRIRLNEKRDSVLSVEECTSKQGLPSNYAMTFRLNSGEIVFCTDKGVYRYNSGSNRFEPIPEFGSLTSKVTQFVQAANGDIYYEQVMPDRSYEKGILKEVKGKFITDKTAFEKFSDISTGDCPDNIISAPDGSIYLGTGYGLLRYKPGVNANYNFPYNTLIRKVYANDSLLFGGEQLNYPFAKKIDGIAVPYSENNLVFHFSCTSFEDNQNNLFSYRLVGSDKNWSEWTTDRKKEYTNLPEGHYIFQVKSRNQYQVYGTIASYSFSILPPWYRTGIAFVLYFLLFAVFLFFIVKLYSRRLVRQKENLEKQVTERTVEVMDQKKEIEENNDVLTRINNQLNESNKELNQTNEKLRITLDIVSTQKAQIEAANRQITTQNKELHKYRDHLEQLVDERTKELLQAKNKAEESDRLKTAFLQNMSHEIRTPMNGILGFLELLKEPDLDESNKNSYIEIINTSGQRLLNTINDIIELSRIESNQLSVSYSRVDLMEMMNYHFSFFRRQADEKGLTLLLSARINGKQSIVETDRRIVDNILINLINNAIKFTRKGTVEFGNYLEGDNMIFYVRDTGMGIPPERQEAIFERFVQADMNNTRTHEGSGLGLAIVKGYLELLDGKIWVESEAGKGSAFFFSIPYRQYKKKPVSAVDRQDHKIMAGRELSILIVEDDENSYLYLKNILKKLNAKISHACNGAEAIEAVRENPGLSLLLMDIKMPDMNGFEATARIREFNKTIPIIAQSAYAFSEEKDRAFEAGINDYLIKPINSKELIQIIRNYID